MNKEVIYVGDPMCSWCYGFTQVIGELRSRYQDRAKFSLVMGGLRPDGTHVVDQRYSDFLEGHWQEIGERTGQPFSLSILDRLGWIYDTEKACRAVVTLRLLQPGSEWAYFVAAQTAFYRDNHDPNDPDSFARVAEGFGIDRQSFLDSYLGDEAREATQGDFRWARSVGVDSFPTVVLRDEGGLAALTIGYRPLAQLEPLLGRWLDR
jgi:putative protein-disulfide isomerase